jgi:hypothetical protein
MPLRQTQNPQQNSALRLIRRGVRRDRLERVLQQAERRVAVALRRMETAVAAHTASELAHDAAMENWDTDRAAAMATDDAATDAAVLVENASDEVDAARAAAAVAAAALIR